MKSINYTSLATETQKSMINDNCSDNLSFARAELASFFSVWREADNQKLSKKNIYNILQEKFSAIMENLRKVEVEPKCLKIISSVINNQIKLLLSTPKIPTKRLKRIPFLFQKETFFYLNNSQKSFLIKIIDGRSANNLDQLRRVLIGEESHKTCNEIERKMALLGLGLEDLEDVLNFLKKECKNKS